MDSRILGALVRQVKATFEWTERRTGRTGRTGGQETGGRMDGPERRTDGRAGWTDRRDGRMDGRTDGRTDGHPYA
jgi:hypothetical protein